MTRMDDVQRIGFTNGEWVIVIKVATEDALVVLFPSD